jgi:hypothetical protein
MEDQKVDLEVQTSGYCQAVEPAPVKEPYSKEDLMAFLNDPEERKNAVALAAQVQQYVGKNWFSLNRFMRKAKETRQSSIFKLKFLEGFGLLQQKMGTWQDGKESRGDIVFKVVISNEDKINALDEIILYHKSQLEDLERQKKNLQTEK